MASRRLALMGASSGPWVYTARVRTPHLRVCGLGTARLHVHQRSVEGVVSVVGLGGDGTHPLDPAPWMRVECVPPQRSVVAEILSGAP